MKEQFSHLKKKTNKIQQQQQKNNFVHGICHAYDI